MSMLRSAPRMALRLSQRRMALAPEYFRNLENFEAAYVEPNVASTSGNYGTMPKPKHWYDYIEGQFLQRLIGATLGYVAFLSFFYMPWYAIPIDTKKRREKWAINADYNISVMRYGKGKNYLY